MRSGDALAVERLIPEGRALVSERKQAGDRLRPPTPSTTPRAPLNDAHQRGFFGVIRPRPLRPVMCRIRKPGISFCAEKRFAQPLAFSLIAHYNNNIN